MTRESSPLTSTNNAYALVHTHASVARERTDAAQMRIVHIIGILLTHFYASEP